MTDATLTAMGFTATQTDAALIVHNVPIFCACERGEHVFDETWVRDAVAKAMRRQREGYFPPLHVKHHAANGASTDPVRAAGHFKITTTGPITLGGIRRTAVFADLYFTDPSAAHEALAARLPYRSIEILKVDEGPSIDSLALLDHEPPYLELPMLMVGEVADARTGDNRDYPVAGATFQNADAPLDWKSMVAFSACDGVTRLTFREDPMPTPKKPNLQTILTGASSNRKPVKFEADDKDVKKADGEKMEADEGDGEGEAVEGEATLDVGAICKAIESGSISVADMDALLAAIQSQGATEEVVEEEPAAPAPAPGEVMKADSGQTMQFAQMRGELDALKAAGVAREASDLCAKDVAAAMVRLSGLPLGSDLEDKLTAFRAESSSKLFGAYVESFAANTPPRADPNDPTTMAFDALGGKLPDVAMSYSAEGTERVNLAAGLAREHADLLEHGLGIRSTVEDYVRRGMARAAG